jgi:hypothetical protein
MAIWVRSQDGKRLVNVQYLSISHHNAKQICGDVGVAESDFMLGEYLTDQRALEVLNDIEEHIVEMQLAKLTNQNHVTRGSLVYKMPEK